MSSILENDTENMKYEIPANMPLCATTGLVLGRCWQHRPSTGPVLACKQRWVTYCSNWIKLEFLTGVPLYTVAAVMTGRPRASSCVSEVGTTEPTYCFNTGNRDVNFHEITWGQGLFKVWMWVFYSVVYICAINVCIHVWLRIKWYI